jgi:Trk K+ transport system NAD-binding subunit
LRVGSDGCFVIVGGDALALRVCAELAAAACGRVVVLWHRDDDLRARVEHFGATFAARGGDERESLLAAGVRNATAIVALTEDDHTNLHFVLTARDENPKIRVVLRQFNRALGRKIQENLTDSSVVSLSSHVAATYAAAAADCDCFYGVQFPDIDGPLAGFSAMSAAEAGVAGCRVDEAQERLDARILAVAGDFSPDAARPLGADERLMLFARVRVRRRGRARPWRWRVRFEPHRLVRGFDRVVRNALIASVLCVVAGSLAFASLLHLDPLTAAYFVVTTMTTTGYGDISPLGAGTAGKIGAMVLMLAGLIFSGIFIALLSSVFTQARYDAVEGLRRITHGGHIVVCGAGNVGSRVIEFLTKLGCRIVAVEQAPRPEIVEGSRDGRFELLTGDAARDTTLALCNIEDAIGLIALTNGDTQNLEVALGARARNPSLHIVMRVQQETFARSVSAQFDLKRTYGTAALMAPVLAGLAFSPGMRGRVEITGRAFDIVEMTPGVDTAAPEAPGCIPLAVWRNGFVLLQRFEDAACGELVLFLLPLAQVPAARASEERAS